MKTAKKTILILFLFTLINILIHVVVNVHSGYADHFWTIVAVTVYYYSPVLLVEGLAYLGIRLWEKYKHKKET